MRRYVASGAAEICAEDLAVNMPTPDRPLRGLTILVIDDHRDTVDMFQQYFTASGAEVIGASSAKSALVVLEHHVLDAAVVDLRMPYEDGWWFLSQLRASRTSSAGIPVFASVANDTISLFPRAVLPASFSN